MAPRPAIKRPSRRGSPRAPDTPAVDPGLLDSLVAAWPGPAARLRGDGTVASANAIAAPVLDALASRTERGGLAGFVAAACAADAARTDTIVVTAPPVTLTVEISVVPGPDSGLVMLGRDISLAANLRQALTDSRQRFKDLVEISSDFAWETDARGLFTFVSPKGALGWRAMDLVGRPAASLVDDEGGPAALPFTTRALVDQAELWLRRADGSPACVSVSALPLVGPDGAWRGARGVWRDVTEIHARDEAMAEAQNRDRLVGYVVRTIRDEVEPDAMLGTAASAVARALGTAGCRIWRYDATGGLAAAAEFGTAPPPDAETRLAAHAQHLKQSAEAKGDDSGDELVLATPSGPFLGAVTRFRREINGAIGLWRAVSGSAWSDADRDVVAKLADQIGIAQEQIANHKALAKQARTDALTGLLNRRSFTKRVEDGLAACRTTGQPGTLVFVDLDNFKAVNDRLGHPAGDAALKGLAVALRNVARATDIVARLGGDEFALWLATADTDAAVARAKLILSLKDDLAPFSAGPDKPLGLSIGLAVYSPAAPETAAELLARADAAMYEVKHKGKGSYAVAPPALSVVGGAVKT